VAEQAGGPGQQRESAQHLDRQAEIGESGAADSGAVERQLLSQDARMDPPDRLEQGEVRAVHPFLGGDPQQHRRPRILDLVHRVAQPGDATGARLDGGQRDRVPVRVRPVLFDQIMQEPSTVLGHAEEAGSAAEQPGGHRALQGLRRAEVGQPGRDRGRREPVVGQRDQHRLEHPRLARAGPPPGHQPERQLTEADLAHQVGGQVLPEQPDLLLVGGADRGGKAQFPVSHARISSPCSSSPGGGP
jgi:hypothetical protein